ncbi:MAG: hypothetical protein JXR96_15650 [Deltaproteobacteria bacterium]|nr:hypothetical protein [Deltaproteobacteria bacterium]
MLLLLWAWLTASTARASSLADTVWLEMRLLGQGYQTRTVAGQLIDRRRISQWVSLRAVRLLGMDGLQLGLQLRIDSDLAAGAELQAGEEDLVDLLAAYASMRDLFGRLDVTLGRQLLLDELGFAQLDGLSAEGRLPGGLVLGVQCGLDVRDRTWLGEEIVELDGVESGEVPAAVLGASLGFQRSWLWAGVQYRRTMLWAEGWPLDDERLGGSASLRLADGTLGLDAGAAYHLARDRLERLRADGFARCDLGRAGSLRIELGLLHERPLFALDSIFNFFSPAPFGELHAGLRWDAGEVLSVRAASFHRLYREADDDASFRGGTVHGGRLEGRLALGRGGHASASASFEQGETGLRWLLCPALRWILMDGRLQLDARALAIGSQDPVQESLSAVTLGSSAGATWRFRRDQAVHATAELNGNRLNPLQFRLLVVLDLAFGLGAGGGET